VLVAARVLAGDVAQALQALGLLAEGGDLDAERWQGRGDGERGRGARTAPA
jgi:hypothetical protein